MRERFLNNITEMTMSASIILPPLKGEVLHFRLIFVKLDVLCSQGLAETVLPVLPLPSLSACSVSSSLSARTASLPLSPPCTASQKAPRRGFELPTSRPRPQRTNRLDYEIFLERRHLHTYLIGANEEKYPLINHSLVTTIMS